MQRVSLRRARAPRRNAPPVLPSTSPLLPQTTGPEDEHPAEQPAPPSPTGNANLVMLWLIVPLVAVILWQLLLGNGP